MPYGFNNDKSKYDLNALVTGVKGDNEELFRTGEVNITKEHIGLSNVANISITVSDSAPSASDGNNGDIWVEY